LGMTLGMTAYLIYSLTSLRPATGSRNDQR